MNVKSVAGETKPANYSTGAPATQETAIELTLRVSMGAPAKARPWEEFKSREGWKRRDYVDSGLRKIRPAKVKKDDPGGTLAEKFDEAAEKKRLDAEYDAQLRQKYERECDRVNAANARFLEKASAFAMFLALRGTEVQLALSPVQQGFKDMFASSGEALALGAGDQGLDDDEGDDD
jgi:hypothetical protein